MGARHASPLPVAMTRGAPRELRHGMSSTTAAPRLLLVGRAHDLQILQRSVPIGLDPRSEVHQDQRQAGADVNEGEAVEAVGAQRELRRTAVPHVERAGSSVDDPGMVCTHGRQGHAHHIAHDLHDIGAHAQGEHLLVAALCKDHATAGHGAEQAPTRGCGAGVVDVAAAQNELHARDEDAEDLDDLDPSVAGPHVGDGEIQRRGARHGPEDHGKGPREEPVAPPAVEPRRRHLEALIALIRQHLQSHCREARRESGEQAERGERLGEDGDSAPRRAELPQHEHREPQPHDHCHVVRRVGPG
mmetsp:Transcript_107869/g.302053  ORF Transcript_107869/g.302053 Transcript_107869/m.302053 type:complete len:302 (-) Transcript_107869:106-1011(-)